VRNAIAYEIDRQQKVLQAGGVIEQVTMGWDENRGVTVLQRTKEGDTGYRYFPEPDLPPLDLDPVWIEQIKASLPELPDAKIVRYSGEFGLSKKEARILAEDKAVAEYYEASAAAAANVPGVTPKLISNWVSGELFRLLGETGTTISEVKIQPAHLVALIELVNAKTINQTAAKQTFGLMFETGRSPKEIVEELGLQQISDQGQLVAIVQQVITAHPEPVQQFKAGKEATLKFLVGQIMRATRGKADPQLAEQLLRENLRVS
jgi:aspartyl-tRNA(Asn)/glutamyl-tRNA(Gln) amidotransferase subunit B